jgi:hypothetical protein
VRVFEGGGGFVGPRSFETRVKPRERRGANLEEFATHFGGMLSAELASPRGWLGFVRDGIVHLAGVAAQFPVDRWWTEGHRLHAVHDVDHLHTDQVVYGAYLNFWRLFEMAIHEVDRSWGPLEAIANGVLASPTLELEYAAAAAIAAAAPKRRNPWREPPWPNLSEGA